MPLKLKTYVTIPNILLVLILLLGAYLRLFHISQYMTFLGDEGRDMLVIKRMIVDHKFTLLGPTASVGGFFLGPIYYYFMLPFVWIFGMNPVGAAVMVALFGIATIYLVYRFTSELFDPWAGVVASALYAVSPLVIAYSRSSWNPNLVPFFSTLLFYLLWKSVQQDRGKLLFWIGVVLGIGLQLHYLFLFLFPVMGLWFLLNKRKKSWIPYYGLCILGFMVGYGPFLAFELRHGFPNTTSIIRFLLAGKETGFAGEGFFTIIADVTYRIFGRLLLRTPPNEQLGNLTNITKLAWEVGTKFTILVTLGTVVLYQVKKLWDGWIPKQNTAKDISRYLLLVLWFTIPVVLFGFYKKGIYDYYFGILFTLPFILSGLVLRTVAISKIGRGVAIIIFAGLLYLNWEGRPYKYPPNNQLAQAKLIALAALSKTDGKPFNFALLANFNSDHAYRYFFEVAGRTPVTIENEAVDPKRNTVTEQLIVICELNECNPLGNSLWEIAGFGSAQVVGEWPVSFVKIIKLVHYVPKNEEM